MQLSGYVEMQLSRPPLHRLSLRPTLDVSVTIVIGFVPVQYMYMRVLTAIIPHLE